MGALVGLLVGVGLLLIWRSFEPPPPPRTRTRPTRRERLADLLAQAGVEAVTPAALVLSCAGTGIVVLMAMPAVSRSPVLALAFGIIVAYSALAVVRARQRKRRTELRELWPEVVDNLASGVRAGLSLPEALSQIGVRGPTHCALHFVDSGRTTARRDGSPNASTG